MTTEQDLVAELREIRVIIKRLNRFPKEKQERILDCARSTLKTLAPSSGAASDNIALHG